MAVVTKKIANLPASTSVASTDVFVKETSGGVTQKITGGDLADQINSGEEFTGANALTTSHTITNAKLIRIGKVVFLTAYIVATSNIAANTEIAKIRNGNNSYWPTPTTYGHIQYNNTLYPLYCGYGGIMTYVNIPSGGGIAINLMYMI